MTRPISFLVAGLLLAGLYLTTFINYLVFHTLVEMFSVVIASGIFMMGWNSRQFLKNSYLMLLGIAYFYVGGLDLLHTLVYRGMGVFPGYGTNEPTQLWIAARGMESVSLALAPMLLRRRVRTDLIFVGYTVVTILLILSILTWGVFPDCFVEGQGLTAFKRGSEYAICGMLLLAIYGLLKGRESFDKDVVRWLVCSMVLTIASELAFTLYIDAYGMANLIGHYLKIISFYMVYKAIIQTGLTQPYALLFRDLKQSEERYRSLFTHMINGVARNRIIVDATGQPVDFTFLEVNEAFERMTGLEAAKLIGTRATAAIPGITTDPADWIRIFGKVALTGESIRFEHYVAALEKWYSVIAYCPTPGCFVTVLEEITPRKRAEAALQTAREQLIGVNEDLEKKVRERTAKLEETISDLEQFSYSIVHDMRAPLRSMNAFSTLLLQDCKGKLNAENVDYLERIASAARRLDGLIQDVLNYGKVARGDVIITSVPLDPLVREIVQGYPCFHSDQAHIEVDYPLRPVRGNAALLTLCISNLLGNAVKFTPPNTRAEVRLWTDRTDGAGTKILVRDNGIGIEPHHLDRIWRIFERLHHRNEYSGTGIGLSIVKRAVERMDGKVGVESKPGEGSTFWFELPKGE